MNTKLFYGFTVLAFCIAISTTAQTTQYITLVGSSGSRPLQTNQLISVIGYDYTNKPVVTGRLADGTQINLAPYFSLTGVAGIVTSAQIPQIATGMTNINLSGGGWATFQITTPTVATVVSNYVPADAIVIPASATGTVQIILESSPDLVNWTAANPGTYGASAGTNRFFRVRAQVGP